MYFSLIRLTPNFYDYLNNVFKINFFKHYIYLFYNPKFKNLSSGYDCFWYMLV